MAVTYAAAVGRSGKLGLPVRMTLERAPKVARPQLLSRPWASSLTVWRSFAALLVVACEPACGSQLPPSTIDRVANGDLGAGLAA
jgi:hypothetical protein